LAFCAVVGHFKSVAEAGTLTAAKTMTEHKPRIAASSYLNTAPLIWSFTHGSQRESVELFTDTAPARCAEMLLRAEVDVALVPVIEYQRIQDISIVPNVCVGSKTAVRSVVLVTRKNNLKKVERVALDESSRTSAALVKIIFSEFLGFEPEWITAAPDLHSMMQQADAALLIGDPAMSISRAQFRVFDLATLWHEFTGCGFVFAMWMARNEEKTRTIDFAAARDEGLANLEQIVATYARPIGLSKDEARKYLTDNVAFTIDAEMKKGLSLYFDLAAKLDLIPRLQPLRFLS
jgi:chorismate dehydratase